MTSCRWVDACDVILGCLFISLYSVGQVSCDTIDVVSGKKELLIGGMFPMSGGWAGGIGCKPAVQMALDAVNKNPDILGDYNLRLFDVDSQCMPGLSLNKMYSLLYDNQTKIVLMTGCSSVSTIVAQAAKMWNLIVLSYGSSSPALSDRKRFPTFFRTHPSATLHNPTRLKLFKRFGWSRIATVQQTEEVFTSTIKDLEEVLKHESAKPGGAQIEISIRQSFQTDPTNAVKSLKRQDARIIVGVFYEDMARKVFCQAYKEGLYGRQYVWLIIGWYPDMWYAKPDPNIDCTPDQLKVALEGHLTTEVVQYNLNLTKTTDTGITAEDFQKQLNKALKDKTADQESLTQIAGFVEAPLAYDAIWALSFALDKTVNELAETGERLENFHYKNERIKDAIFASLNRTDFEGVSGRVSFTSTGDRIAKTQIEQMQDGVYTKIGYYSYVDDQLDWLNRDLWIGDSPPPDRTFILDKLRVISSSLSYIMSSLAGLGIIFSFTALVFNISSRKYSLVENSTPNLNSLVAIGCMMTLACVPLFSLDGAVLTPPQYVTICEVKTWLITLGFTISYGTMFVKILYSWRISKKVKESKPGNSPKVIEIDPKMEKSVHAWEPYAILASFLALDLILLGVWHGVDPLYRAIDEFEPYRPETDMDERDIMYRPLLEHCDCEHMSIWIGLFYGYKGFLLVVGLFLAYETRNVKVRTINDLKFMAMAVYNVVVLCLIAVPVTLIIPNQQNASFVFISIAIILGCYLTIGLIFIPKMKPILTRRLDMGEEDVQASLVNYEIEKRYEQLKERNEGLKQEIAQKEKQIRDLHSVLQQKFSKQISDDGKTSDSAFSDAGSNIDRLLELSDASNSSKTSNNFPQSASAGESSSSNAAANADDTTALNT